MAMADAIHAHYHGHARWSRSIVPGIDAGRTNGDASHAARVPRDDAHAAPRGQAARQQRQRPGRAGACGDARQGRPRPWAPGGRARGPGRRRARALGQPPRALRFRQRVLRSRPDQARSSQPG